MLKNSANKLFHLNKYGVRYIKKKLNILDSFIFSPINKSFNTNTNSNTKKIYKNTTIKSIEKGDIENINNSKSNVIDNSFRDKNITKNKYEILDSSKESIKNALKYYEKSHNHLRGQEKFDFIDKFLQKLEGLSWRYIVKLYTDDAIFRQLLKNTQSDLIGNRITSINECKALLRIIYFYKIHHGDIIDFIPNFNKIKDNLLCDIVYVYEKSFKSLEILDIIDFVIMVSHCGHKYNIKNVEKYLGEVNKITFESLFKIFKK